MKHRNIVVALVVIMALALVGCCVTLTVWADEAADILRSIGYAEDSPAIRALGEAWMKEQENLDIVAKVIQHEADPKMALPEGSKS